MSGSGVAQSCVSLPATCGASGNDDCCNSPPVTGGTFFRGYDVAGDSSSGDMSAPATLSDFRLDKYEVTVGRFRAFVAAGQGTQANPPSDGLGAHPHIFESGWKSSWNSQLPATQTDLIKLLETSGCTPGFMGCGWTPQPGANESLPITDITWLEAQAFCTWDGGYLPTDTEWDYAAAGGDQQRVYPWSSPPGSTAIDRTHASYDIPGDSVGPFQRVGSLPDGDGRWGQSDLAGSVTEYTFDAAVASYPVPCNDCCTSCPPNRGGASALVHGGSWDDGAVSLRNTFRTTVAHDGELLGFRCARPAN
jgi:formylglycine-generating enzyme